MAKKKSTKINQELLNKYTIAKDEREIVGKFGEYEVYTPDERYGKLLYSIGENANNFLNSENQLEISGEFLAKILKVLTNLPDDFLEILPSIVEQNLETTLNIKKVIACVSEQVNSDMADMLIRIDQLNNMKPEKRDLLMKQFLKTIN